MTTPSVLSFTGFTEADAILAQLPLLLRGREVSKAMRDAMTVLVNASSREAPQPGASKGGITYTPLRGERADRKRLFQGISQVFRRYNGGEVLLAVGGPVRSQVGRHAHLVEFGFHHTSGGTFAGSGGRTRSARKQVGVRLTRLLQRGGPVSAANMSGASVDFALRRVSDRRLEKLRRKFATQRLYAKADDRTGKGRRTSVVPGRSFTEAVFERHKQQIQDGIIRHLREFAERFAQRQAKAAAKGKP